MKWVKLLKNWAGHSVGEVIELSADDSQTLVESKFAEFTANPEEEIVTKAFEQFSSKIQKSAEDMFTKIGDAVESSVKRVRIDPVESEAEKTKSFGDFLCCVHSKNHERLVKVYNAKTALAESSGVLGGYTVPAEFLAKLMKVAGEESIVRPRAMHLTMGSRTIQVPAFDQTTARSTGVSPYFGGMQAKWIDESGSRPETNPTFKQIELVAHELAGYTPVSNTLLADSAVALDELLTTMFAKLIAWHEDYAFLVGDGVGKPRGVLNAPATVSVTRDASNSFKLVDAAKMWSKLLPASQMNAVWVMNQSVIPQLIQLKDDAQRVIFMPTAPTNGSLTGAMPMTLLGRPIYFTEKTPALGTAGDVLLLDLNYYLVADRGTIEVQSSDQALFLTNQMAWRFTKRLDGQPWMDSYITYQDGSTTVSPFVKLS